MSMPPQLNLDDIKKEDPLKKNSPFTINGKPKYELGPAAEILPFLYLGSAAHAVDTEALKKAIKLFQYRFGLEVNGELDSSTLSLMSQPRCGDKGNVKDCSDRGEFYFQAIL